jgi:hypothetical protein
MELKARGQPITGVKSDLKKRLIKIIQQEKVDKFIFKNNLFNFSLD